MTHFSIPLVPSDVLYLSLGEDIAGAVSAAVASLVTPHGFTVRDLAGARDPQLRAQALTHDIRNLLRETPAEPALHAFATGHDGAVIVGIARGTNGYRLVTLHRHFVSDHPDLAARFVAILADHLPGLSLDTGLIDGVQAQADAVLGDGVVTIRDRIARIPAVHAEKAVA